MPDISYPDLSLPRENETRHVIDDQVGSIVADISDASESHTINSTFNNTEVAAALDALGAKYNELLSALKGE